MITLLLHLLRLLPVLCGGHRQVALENLALRHQLAVYKKTVNRPKLRSSDRLFWVALSRAWAGWRQPLVIVTPNTVLRWQRLRFREHWTKLSGRPRVGRPPLNAEINALVAKLAAEAVQTTLPDLANVPDQSRPRPRLDRLLHRSDRSPARALRPDRARPSSPASPPLQRHRASDRRLDGSTDRGHLPGRYRALLSPPRS